MKPCGRRGDMPQHCLRSLRLCQPQQPGRIRDGSNGLVACDHYHLWPQDLDMAKSLGVNAYRFSIAWPRILPTGTGAVETRGLDFYDRLVDGLLEAGITPMACLYHWDLPQPLEDAGGWQGREIVGPFADYARIVTARLADRVKHWMMLNEPNVVAIFGYGVGEHAPGHKLGEQGILRALHHHLAEHQAGRSVAEAILLLRGHRYCPSAAEHTLPPNMRLASTSKPSACACTALPPIDAWAAATPAMPESPNVSTVTANNASRLLMACS